MGGGHGIGIKRNDYRRRNRKRNISMHCTKHGYNKHSKHPDKVRVIKHRATAWSQFVDAYNQKQEEERWARLLERYEIEEEIEEVNLTGIPSSLASERLTYIQPCLPREDIRYLRFENGLDSNDRWWEWQK